MEKQQVLETIFHIMHKLRPEVVILSLNKAFEREEEMQLHCNILVSSDSTKAA